MSHPLAPRFAHRPTAAIVLVVAGAIAWIAASGPRPAAEAQTPAERSPCIAIGIVGSRPWGVRLGEEVEVFHNEFALCPSGGPRHVVLVLDGSEAVDGEMLEHQKLVARRVVKDLELREPGVRVGVVAFGAGSFEPCALTDNATRASGCIGKLAPAGTGSWAHGLESARALLEAGRSEAPGEIPVGELIVLLAAGSSADACEPVSQAAQALRDDGVRLVTGCLGPDCDAACLGALAARPGDAFDAGAVPVALPGMVRSIARGNVAVRELRLTATMGAEVDYVEGSAVPPPSDVLEAGRQLVWRMPWPAHEDEEMVSYRVRPRSIGHIELVTTGGTFVDPSGRLGELRAHLPPTVWVFEDRVPDALDFALSLHALFPSVLNGASLNAPPSDDGR